MNSLFVPSPRTGIWHRSTEPRGGTPGPGPFPFRSLPPQVPALQGLSRTRLQALPGGSRPGQGPSQTPPSPGPAEILTQDRWGALGNRAIATRRFGGSANGQKQRSSALWRRRHHRGGSASRQHKDRPHRRFGRSTMRTPLPSHAGQASVRQLLGSRRIKPRPLHSVHLTAVCRSSVFSMARKSPWMIAMASWSAERV
jgi:hypothetical protein